MVTKESIEYLGFRINIYWEDGYATVYKDQKGQYLRKSDHANFRLRLDIDCIDEAIKGLAYLKKSIENRKVIE